ncbi:GTPase activating protein, Tsc2 paralog [Schizosaccharomyces pombe]|uniref:Uncharacterized protein C18B11.11 n=1 Tax=Schizosaccharomyces pombe (strain 972 / ATCC 24843) TaxID=284812 RepID=YA3B_SCHPO|nr:putative GTPase-activating protein [Schizosaccharomyces pombe]Q09716.1 RecName: Full=Uncharacterized protein C18B11.11 [Schizosaccharomyces pombe 972h-]CAA92229.2 GTPase activating protein (predicted) [Schizosaccharomyces pombe]|eukprot:NP_001342803.1 putative GTPase-activating protein [Schizosaccharomyces pombe]
MKALDIDTILTQISNQQSLDKRYKRIKRLINNEQFCKNVILQKLVDSTKDIIENKVHGNILAATISLWTHAAEKHKEMSSDDRALLFNELSKVPNSEYYPATVDALIVITSQGERTESFSNDILKVLSEWLTDLFTIIDDMRAQSRKSFKGSAELRNYTRCFRQIILLLTNMFRVGFNLFDEMEVSSMLANCVWVSKSTTDEEDIALVFSLLNCIISYGRISSAVLYSIVEVVCRAKFGLVASSQSAQQIVEKLLKTATKYEALNSLKRIMEETDEGSYIAIMGGIQIVSALFTDIPRSVYCTRGMLLGFLQRSLKNKSSRIALETTRSLYNALERRSFVEVLYADEWISLLDLLVEISSSLPKSLNYRPGTWQHIEPNIIESIASYQLQHLLLFNEILKPDSNHFVLEKFHEFLKINFSYLTPTLSQKLFTVLDLRSQLPYSEGWLEDQTILLKSYFDTSFSLDFHVYLIGLFRKVLFACPVELRPEVYARMLCPLVKSLDKSSSEVIIDEVISLVCDLSWIYPSNVFHEVKDSLCFYAHNSSNGDLQLRSIQAIVSLTFYYVLLPEFKSVLYDGLVEISCDFKIRRTFRIPVLKLLLQLRINTNDYCFVNLSPAQLELISVYSTQWHNPFISEEAQRCRDNKVKDRDLSFSPVFQKFPLKVNTSATLSKDLMSLPINEWVKNVMYIVTHETDWKVVQYILINFTNQLRNTKMFTKTVEALQLLLNSLRDIINGKQSLNINFSDFFRIEDLLVSLSKILSVLMVYKDVLPPTAHEQFFQLLNRFAEKGDKTMESCIDTLITNCCAMQSFSIMHLPKFFSITMSSNLSERSLVNFLRLLHVVSDNWELNEGLEKETIQSICLFCLKVIRTKKEELDGHKKLVNPNTKVFCLYLVSFSYSIISNLFLGCETTERAQLASFLLKEFLNLKNGSHFEGYERVFYELLLRYTYSDERIESYPSDSRFHFNSSSKSWLYRGCVITINAEYETGDYQMILRRMSGTTIYRFWRNMRDRGAFEKSLMMEQSMVSSELKQKYLQEIAASHVFMETVLSPLDSPDEEPILIKPDARTEELIQSLDATHTKPVINIAVALQAGDVSDINTTVGWQLFYRLLESFGHEKKLDNGETIYVWQSKTIEMIFRYVSDPAEALESSLYSSLIIIGSDDLVGPDSLNWDSVDVPVIIKISLDSHLDALKMFDTLFHVKLEIITTGTDISHQSFWKLDQIISTNSIAPLLHSYLADIGLYQMIFENFAYVHPWLLRQQYIDTLYTIHQVPTTQRESSALPSDKTFDFTLFL